jgi:hypothetical protein
MKLKGGNEAFDPRLGRLKQHDPRSRDYPARGVLYEADAPLRSRTWACNLLLDQGQHPTCVGNAFTHELAAVPKAIPNLDEKFAVGLYHDAQQMDEWPGDAYEGSSGLGGAAACKARGFYSEYRWAFGTDDALQAVSHYGPVCLGIPWLAAMSHPRPSGLLEVDGPEIGGHEILIRGHLLKARLKGEGKSLHVVRLRNSWGDWGAGTVVNAYPASKIEPYYRQGIAPPSNIASVESQTVAAGGKATFAVLPLGQPHYVFFGGKYIQVVGR